MADGVRYETGENIATITLDHPPVNALTTGMLDRITAHLKIAAADDQVRCVIVASAVSKRFCAGLDLSVVVGDDAAGVRRVLEKLYLELFEAQRDLGKPSIAAVDGAARGGGMTMAISCDVILASDAATFGYPEIDL